MFLMTLRDLQYRSRRVALVIVLVALVLTLLYLMSGLVNHLKSEPYDTVSNIAADHWVVAEGVSGPFTAVSVVPVGVADELPDDARPMVATRGSLVLDDGESAEMVLFGHVPGELGQPRLTRGEPITGPGEVVLDESLDLGIGTQVSIGGDQFEIVGWTRNSTVLAGQAVVFIDLDTAQQLAFQNSEVVSGYLITGDAPSVSSGLSVLSADEAAADTLGPIESAVSSIDLIRALLWFVAAIVMGAVTYLTALERERDFAVLKAVGASGRSLGSGLAAQAVLIAVLAALIGAVAAKLIEPAFPLPVSIPGSSLVLVPVVAALVGLASAMLGVRKVNRTDPSEAFG